MLEFDPTTNDRLFDVAESIRAVHKFVEEKATVGFGSTKNQRKEYLKEWNEVVLSRLQNCFDSFVWAVCKHKDTKADAPGIPLPSQMTKRSARPARGALCATNSTTGSNMLNPPQPPSSLRSNGTHQPRPPERRIGSPERGQLGSQLNQRQLQQLVVNAIAPSLYCMLEACVHRTGAERGVILLHDNRTVTNSEGEREQKDVLRTIAAVGPEMPRQYEVPAKDGIPGAVLSSGIALNYMSEAPADAKPKKRDTGATAEERAAELLQNFELLTSPRTNKMDSRSPLARNSKATPILSSLCLPLRDPGKPSVVGVLQLVNKFEGKKAFSVEDEAKANIWGSLMSYLLIQYNYLSALTSLDQTTLSQGLFEPQTLHTWAPFEPLKEDPTLTSLPSAIQRHSPIQLVYRSRNTNVGGPFVSRRNHLKGQEAPEDVVFSSVQASPIISAATLVDVTKYISNLEECWRNSTMEAAAVRRQQMADKDETKRRKRALKMTTEVLQDTREEAETYHKAYELLRSKVSEIAEFAPGFSAYASPSDRPILEDPPPGTGREFPPSEQNVTLPPLPLSARSP